MRKIVVLTTLFICLFAYQSHANKQNGKTVVTAEIIDISFFEKLDSILNNVKLPKSKRFINLSVSSVRDSMHYNPNYTFCLNDTSGIFISIMCKNSAFGEYYVKYRNREFILEKDVIGQIIDIPNIYNNKTTFIIDRDVPYGYEYIFLYKDGQISVVTDEKIWFNLME